MARALASLALLLALGLAACGSDPDADKEPKSSKTGVTPISLAWLLRTYAENPSRADAMYRGRLFEFSATVAAVDKDGAGHPALTLRTAEEGGGVSCVGGGGDTKLAAVANQATVKVRAKVVGLNTKTSLIVLSDCQVVG